MMEVVGVLQSGAEVSQSEVVVVVMPLVVEGLPSEAEEDSELVVVEVVDSVPMEVEEKDSVEVEKDSSSATTTTTPTPRDSFVRSSKSEQTL